MDRFTGLANGIQLQPISNCISDSMSTTDSMHNQDQMSGNGNNQNGQRTTSRDNGNQSAGQGMIIVSANSNQSLSTNSNAVGNQSQFAYMTPSSQHIVIPLSGGGLLQLAEPQKLACLNQPQIVQLQQSRSRPMTSSSSTSGISSVAGQGDIDLLSTSSGVMDSSQLYQHCTSAPVQLADCEDQLVQCSSSDEKLLYSAL